MPKSEQKQDALPSLSRSEISEKKLDEAKDLTFLGITVEKSKLTEVTALLGKAIPHQTGDAGSSLLSLCYLGSDGTILQFNSSEMGGGTEVTSIELYSGKTTVPGLKCLRSSQVHKNISNLRGIRLGLTQKSVLQLLGEPSQKVNPEQWNYSFTSKLKLSQHPDDFTVLGTYALVFRNEKLTHIEISQVTSN